MKNTILFAVCIGALLLTGCVSTRQFVPLPDQTKRIEDPSKGRIYVMRPSTLGTAVSMYVSDDGKLIGKTGAHGFLCSERHPGEARIAGTAEGASETALTVQVGDVYYIFEHVRMGVWEARNELQIVSEEEGRKVLKSCHPPTIEAPPPSGVSAVKDSGQH